MERSRHGGTRRRGLWSGVWLALVAGCSGAPALQPDQDGGVLQPACEAPAAPLELQARLLLTASDGTIAKAWPAPSGAGFVLLEELTEQRAGPGWSHPRRLRWVDAAGAELHRHEVPVGEALVDVALHPSGTLSVLRTDGMRWQLERLSSLGAPQGVLTLAPWASVSGRFVAGPWEGGPGDVPAPTWDAGRLVARGEGLGVVVRGGRNTPLLLELAPDPAGGLLGPERQVAVVPGTWISPRGLLSGTFDVFGALEEPFHVHADGAAPEQPLVVALPASQDIVAASNLEWPWLSPLEPRYPLADVLLHVAPPGAGGTPARGLVGLQGRDEVYGVRSWGGDVYVLGRTGGQGADGNGWDALVVRARTSDAGQVWARALDVERGDILFDAAPASAGRVVAVGATGYSQNPHGASVPDEVAPLALVLDGCGSVLGRVALPHAARSNQARWVLALGEDRFLVAGMLDGPGTHAADADRSRGRSRGALWVLEPRGGGDGRVGRPQPH